MLIILLLPTILEYLPRSGLMLIAVLSLYRIDETGMQWFVTYSTDYIK